MLPVLVHDGRRRLHVLEHSLQLRSELTAALRLKAFVSAGNDRRCYLELGDHRLLGVVGDALSEQKTLCKMLLVVTLEHVLLLEVRWLEQGKGWLQRRLRPV